MAQRQERVKKVLSPGHITDGTLFIHHENQFWDRIALLPDGDCLVHVDTGTRRQIRFNNYHFGACQYVADRLAEMGCEGWTAEDVHYCTVREVNSVLKPMIDRKTGEVTQKQIPQGTRDMTTNEFMDFRARFNQYWAEHGIEIPDEFWENKR